MLTALREALSAKQRTEQEKWAALVTKAAGGKAKLSLAAVEDAAECWGLAGAEAVAAFEADVESLKEISTEQKTIAKLEADNGKVDLSALNARIEELAAELREAQRAAADYRSSIYVASQRAGDLGRLKAKSPRLFPELAQDEIEETFVTTTSDIPIGEAGWVTE